MLTNIPTSVTICKLLSDLTSCLLVTSSAHVKHLQLKPAKLKSHAA